MRRNTFSYVSFKICPRLRISVDFRMLWIQESRSWVLRKIVLAVLLNVLLFLSNFSTSISFFISVWNLNLKISFYNLLFFSLNFSFNFYREMYFAFSTKFWTWLWCSSLKFEICSFCHFISLLSFSILSCCSVISYFRSKICLFFYSINCLFSLFSWLMMSINIFIANNCGSSPQYFTYAQPSSNGNFFTSPAILKLCNFSLCLWGDFVFAA